MSDNFRGWLGKDGKRYNTLLEKFNADAVVENSLKQTRTVTSSSRNASTTSTAKRTRIITKAKIPYEVFKKFE